MKAPKRHSNGYHWIPPDQEWLVDQYITQGKSAALISREMQGHVATVLEWLRREGIATRTLVEAKALLRGGASPHWQGGRGSTPHLEARRVLEEAGILPQCGAPNASPVGCGTTKGWIEVHHIDQNVKNNSLKNLQYLCRGCHTETSRELRLEDLSEGLGFRPPRKHPNSFWWDPPSRKWLEHYWVTLGWSLRAIGNLVGADKGTVRSWLIKLDLIGDN